MLKLTGTTAALSAALLLAACGGSDDATNGGEAAALEKGQVVATLDGEDITVHELNAELMGVALPSGERRRAIEQAALQQIINRKILADVARERGLDKTPMYILQERRADEALLVQLLQRDIASKMQQPTREQAERYIAENPQLFAERKIYTLDQIQFQQPEDIRRLQAFEPLTTMDQVEAKLIEDRIQYRRAPAQLDSVGANPELIAQINRLPAGEIFLIPTGQVVLANLITGTKTEPFTGDAAIAYATRQLQQQQLSQAASRELDEKLKKARETVQYQEGFAPPKAPAAGAGKAPAANAGKAPAEAPKTQPAG